jgi:acyl-CoA thioesterase
VHSLHCYFLYSCASARGVHRYTKGTRDWLDHLRPRMAIELCFVALRTTAVLRACVSPCNSDIMFLASALPPHGLSFGVEGPHAVSHDHAVWFHESLRGRLIPVQVRAPGRHRQAECQYPLPLQA